MSLHFSILKRFISTALSIAKIPQLTKDLQQKLTSQFTQNTKIKNSRLGEQAPLFGGNVLIAKNFLNIEDLRFPTIDFL